MTRLRPIVARRGYTVGTAPRRVGSLFYLAMLLFAFAGIGVGTVAMADVVRAIARAS
jgi:hypothetical protein